jgi:hypothetical protein
MRLQIGFSGTRPMRQLFGHGSIRRLFSSENVWALVLVLVVIALIILTADSAPLWIYQGF